MSDIKFTEKEQAEIVTVTLTETIARNVKGALTAKQLAGMLNISPKTVFKLAKAGRIPTSCTSRRYWDSSIGTSGGKNPNGKFSDLLLICNSKTWRAAANCLSTRLSRCELKLKPNNYAS